MGKVIEPLYPWLVNEIQHPKKRAFLIAYSASGNITEAAAVAEVTRFAHYTWLAGDSEYAEAFRRADLAFADELEAEARKRAMFEKSDTLLIFLLKGAKPDKYADRKEIKHSGKIQHEHFAYENLTVSEAEELERILREANARGASALPSD